MMLFVVHSFFIHQRRNIIPQEQHVRPVRLANPPLLPLHLRPAWMEGSTIGKQDKMWRFGKAFSDIQSHWPII